MVSSTRAGHGFRPRPRERRLLYEWRILLLSFGYTLPVTAGCIFLLWKMPWSNTTRFLLLLVSLLLGGTLIAIQHGQIRRPLETLTNIVSALREEDFSLRARGARENGALGELAMEINSLADLLAEQRTRTVEATALLRRIVEVIDAPLFAFDPTGRVRLVNPAGERLLQKPAAALSGRSAEDVGIADWLTADEASPLTIQQAPSSRWLVRRSRFRQDGVPHTLIVLSDVSRALREQERTAWQRLIRVLGHELNNSLAPIKSIAGTLSQRLHVMEMQEQDRQDFAKGLGIIESRSASLHRFLQSYRQLAQMPLPSRRPTEIGTLVGRVAGLETRVKVVVEGGPQLVMLLDPDQIEQMLVNLIRNAAEAALDAFPASAADPDSLGPEVTVFWKLCGREVAVCIRDNGPGFLNPENLFVPFYTTKAEGTGIGLLLSRQIAEAHAGSIQLVNREGAHGCLVSVLLPMV
jgi:two-component system nitrogen regulation sensor histidine kinase NtrY